MPSVCSGTFGRRDAGEVRCGQGHPVLRIPPHSNLRSYLFLPIPVAICHVALYCLAFLVLLSPLFSVVLIARSVWLVVPRVYVVSANLTVKQLRNERRPKYQSTGLWRLKNNTRLVLYLKLIVDSKHNPFVPMA